MKLSDFKGVFTKTAATVLSVHNPHGDYFVVRLRPAQGVIWRPGEHAIFSMPGKAVSGRKWRAFSIASAPEENEILIGTRTGKTPSSFKQALVSLQAGDTVNVRDPFGWFVFQDDTSPVVLIAGGVGITPIRALLIRMSGGHEREATVIFTSHDYYLFRDDIAAITHPDERITFHQTHEHKETQALMDECTGQYGNSAYYYVSGSMKFIRSVKKHLRRAGIKGRRMINDPFIGY